MDSLFFASTPYGKLHQRWLISALGLGWAAHPVCFSSALLCPAGPRDTASEELFKLFCLFLGGSATPLCHVPIAGRWKLPCCRYKRVLWSVIRHVPDDKVLCSVRGTPSFRSHKKEYNGVLWRVRGSLHRQEQQGPGRLPVSLFPGREHQE